MWLAFNKLFAKKPLLISIIFVALFTYFIFLTKAPNDVFEKLRLANDRNPKYVLYWSPFWNTWDYQLGLGFEPFKNCEYSNCFATSNRTLIDLEEFDALVFHASYNKKKHGVPWIRTPRQRYIFMNWEAPVYICPNLKQYAGYFNWTMSYRFDSDIVRRHGYISKEKTNYTVPSDAFLGNKTRLAAWFVTNCRTRGHREDLAKELEKFMPVDVYGSCGKLQCPRKKGNGKISSPECYDMVEAKYKFYFSFENSYCKDYSTEKLYNILSKNIVPVVYGAGDYKLSAPPDSVINVDDFESASDLANFLKHLNDNDEEYLNYFEWKRDYRIVKSLEPSACQICKKLHKTLTQSIYYDLHEWWWGNNKSMCKMGKALPKIVSDLLSEGAN